MASGPSLWRGISRSYAKTPLPYNSSAFVVLLGVMVAAPLKAQHLRSSAPDTSCRCRIELHRITRLGSPQDTVALSERTQLGGQSSRGDFYAADILPPGTVAVFDSAGHLISTIGRNGHGPGDLYGARYAEVTHGDSVLVLDLVRLSLFAPNGAFVRTVNLPRGLRAFRFAVLPDGKVLLNNYMPSHPAFTLLDEHYTEVRTFGRSIAGERFPDSDALLFLISPLDSGRFVAIQQRHSFLVQVWDTTGHLVREFGRDRDPSWFPPWTFQQWLARTPQSAPFPGIIGAYANLKTRQLWITALVADRRWREVAPKPEPGGREVRGPLSLGVNELARFLRHGCGSPQPGYWPSAHLPALRRVCGRRRAKRTIVDSEGRPDGALRRGDVAAGSGAVAIASKRGEGYGGATKIRACREGFPAGRGLPGAVGMCPCADGPVRSA